MRRPLSRDVEMWKRRVVVRTIDGVVAIVTGASSGIGAEIARELARRGARVVLAARRADLLAQVAQQIQDAGGTAVAVPTDVADAAQVRHMVEQAIEAFGRVDVLVNDAGLGSLSNFAASTEEELAHIINVNLLGTMLATHAVLPGMLGHRQGAIISVASVAGIVAVDPAYSATKFGLRGFSLSLRRQLAGSGVSVSLVSPGFIRTSLTGGMRQHLPGPDIVARAVVRLIAHPRREVVVPGYYRGAVWAEHFFPWLIDLAIRPRK